MPAMMSSTSSSGRNARVRYSSMTSSLPTLIPRDLLHQLKHCLFLRKALDLLHQFPPKAPSKTPRGRPICSPEFIPSAAVFLHFRSTRCVLAADYWPHLFPSLFHTLSCPCSVFPRSRTSSTSSTRSRRHTARLRPFVAAASGCGRRRRPLHMLGLVAPHPVDTSPSPVKLRNDELDLARSSSAAAPPVASSHRFRTRRSSPSTPSCSPRRTERRHHRPKHGGAPERANHPRPNCRRRSSRSPATSQRRRGKP